MRRSLFAGLAAATVLLAPAAAFAHVTPSPTEVPKGGADQEITLRVPNESDKASTVKVDVKVPTDHPLLDVAVEEKPGWTFEVKTAKLAKPITTDDGTITESVSEIIWSGGKIAPGGYGDFRIIVGQLPDDTDQLELKTIQTYSDGTETSWIEDPVAEGQPEPEHPAPVVDLVAAGGSSSSSSGSSDSSGSSSSTETKGSTTASSTSSEVSKDDVDSAKTFGLVGIAVGVVGVLVGAFAIVGARRKDAAA